MEALLEKNNRLNRTKRRKDKCISDVNKIGSNGDQRKVSGRWLSSSLTRTCIGPIVTTMPKDFFLNLQPNPGAQSGKVAEMVPSGFVDWTRSLAKRSTHSVIPFLFDKTRKRPLRSPLVSVVESASPDLVVLSGAMQYIHLRAGATRHRRYTDTQST